MLEAMDAERRDDRTAEEPDDSESTVVEHDPDKPCASKGVRDVRECLLDSYRTLLDRREIFYPVQFRFIHELGRGRQGVVFLGLRHGARGCVTRHAIKLFDPSIYPDAASYWTDMGRIASQTSSLQTIRSPNLVDRETYDEVGGIGYTQLEVIHGIDLGLFTSGVYMERVRAHFSSHQWTRLYDVLFRTRGNELRIQPGIAIYIMRMVLRGLEALHGKGFVHGDVKPSNIMLDRLGVVKLIDYGRAARSNERTLVLFGSPLYMAPEVHRREPIQVRSDLYSVGLVGLVLLAGKGRLFNRVMSDAELQAFKLSIPDRLEQILPSYVWVNRPFVNLLRRLLAPDPKDRFPDAQAAEGNAEGLRMLHRQLMMSGIDSDYGREVAQFVGGINLDFWDNITISL